MNAEQRAEFAEVLRHKFADSGMTQPELARIAGISPRAVSDFARNVRLPQDDTLRAIGQALGYAVDADTVRASWPQDVGTFLDLIGTIMVTRAEPIRRQLMRDIVELIAPAVK